jgi:outer membrane protein insertion porin family
MQRAADMVRESTVFAVFRLSAKCRLGVSTRPRPAARLGLAIGRDNLALKGRKTYRISQASDQKVKASSVGHLIDPLSCFRVHVWRQGWLRRAGLLVRAMFFIGVFHASCTYLAGQGQAANSTSQAPMPEPMPGQMLSSYEGQNVTSIDIAGRPQLTSSQFESLFAQKAGQPFSSEKVGRTAAAVKAAGKFDNVRVQVDAEANGVRVLLILEPAVYFGMFQFPGAERFPYSQLVQAANYPIQAPYSAAEVEQDRQKLETFLRGEGYFESTADPEVKVDTEHGIANVVFHVVLNRRARFGSIDIADVTPSEASDLTRHVQTLLARLRGSAIRTGRTYHHSALTKAAESMQNQLQNQGYLGAQVKLAGAQYHADTNRADVRFNVDLGQLTHVQIDGAHLWSWTRKSLLPVYQGIGVDEESVREGQQALEWYYQAKGFFDVKVATQLKKEASDRTIIYTISKEEKHKVAEVKLSGNSGLPSRELTPHIAVQQSHLFSHGKFSDQLVRSSVKNLVAVYESEGFSSVKVNSKVSNRNGNVEVSFEVVEGPRDIVNSLKIEGAATFLQSRFAPGGLKLAAGQPYSQAHVESDRAEIVANYLKAGYLNASFRETASEVSKSEPHRINVVYQIYEGPKVYTADVLTLGRVHTMQRLIDRDVSSIKPEQPLTETELLTAGSRLYDHTAVFDWAEVDPRRQITDQTSEDVLVKVHEAKRNEITYGFGFEVINRGGSIPSGTVALPNLPPVGLPSNFTTSQVTFYGPRGTFEFTRNNVGGKGDSLSFTGFAGRLDQRGAAYYIVPNFLWTAWKATTSISMEQNEENPIFSSREELGSSQIQRDLDKARKNELFLRYSYSHINLTRVEIPALVPSADRNVRLSTLAANFTRDTRDNALDEHRGVLDSIELELNNTKLGSSVDFAKLTAQAAWYKQAFHNIVWAESLRIGLAQPYSNSRVPLSEEFFTGGGNSLRGFPLDGAGPQRKVQICGSGTGTSCTCNGSTTNCDIEVPSGGNELLIFNAEARIPLPFKKGLAMAVFYDGGNVFPNVGFHDITSLYSNNVGLGLRYATPVGPIRFDLGRNLNPVSGINATQYFVSIGQAF